MKAIYKSAALLFGAMSLFSSCEDFLTRDPQDSYLLDDYLNSEARLDDYTKQVRGPMSWFEYEQKFSWCVGEIYSGNVYHNYGDEGEFHFMSFGANNANIANAYTSLYAVIAKCNHIIDDVPGIAEKNGLSQEAINKCIGEAKMYRGMAYFFLAEYWGASPIVLHNAETVSNDVASEITKADRKTLYTLIEKDWKEAYDLLPDVQQNGCRAWKASASGMLTKLYVTMASCRNQVGDDNSYVCPDPNGYYDKAIEQANITLDLCKYLEKGREAYDAMFQPETFSKEILFALLYEQGPYGAGSARQVQFARSTHVSGNQNAWGGEKGLTTMLFDSYDKEHDIRLKATSYYFGPDDSYSDAQTKADALAGRGHYYIMADGSKYYYFLNPGKSLSQEEKEQFYGSEPISQVLNHCRKFVYGVKALDNDMSINLTMPLLRVADVYLLRAEAKMGKETDGNVANPSTAGIEDVNIIRERAGLTPIDKISFCEPDSVSGNGNVAYATVYDTDNNPHDISASCDLYHVTYDLMLERRHEFALENQCWLDIKRLYYRNPEAAVDYIKSQDRGFIYGEKFGTEIAVPQKRADYQRMCLNHDLSVKAHELNPSYGVLDAEKVIQIEKLQFFLPTPASVPNTANYKKVVDYSEQILDGSYKY
ncbi:MAG: RagB/SusD family nutrient uptake outer membrane protein [Paludibacteraceae bacterium]|nr:RagB/SusD family nutrient uptake outer membrane protein [Paludibacteraceae bacterium]